ncbi:hypothetical protein NFI96_034365 [Prochilodus magdalenae]|nr:hypothetical protein NFI96_034365 [Prochilodus magdalenae]
MRKYDLSSVKDKTMLNTYTDFPGARRRKHHGAVLQMDNRGCLSSGGGGEPKLPTSAIQLGHDGEVRQARREPGDPVTSTHVRKDDLSDMPRKVPRFQYVDFPSLHQCIKQLSVPPLEGWLASCPLGRVPSCQPSSPKEKVPKFKYVDYPSLYHCIQQLSVPPLEIWSSGLTRPGSGESRGGLVGQSHAQMLKDSRENHKEVLGNGAELQGKEPKRLKVPNAELAAPQHPRYTVPVLSSETGRNPHRGPDDPTQNPSCSRSESVSRLELDIVANRNERDARPSVISMVRTERQKRHLEPEAWPKRRKSTDPIEQQTLLESICPFCQQMFADPEELRTHQRSHKDKPPYRKSYTEPVPEESELSRKCPHCSCTLKPVQDRAGRPSSRLQCPQCPASRALCEQCLYPCSKTSSCTNKSCQLVSVLLTCDQVTDPLSKVKGCPMFRACPKCRNLMMHDRGCKYVTCLKCQHRYCFICLESTDECRKDTTKYWSLTCAKPRAARQRFQT